MPGTPAIPSPSEDASKPVLPEPLLSGGSPPPPPPPLPVPASKEFKREVLEVEQGLLNNNSEAHSENGSSTSELQLQAARKLRQLLSVNRELLIQEVVSRNWVPLLLDWLKPENQPSVQVESLWVLTNLAAGTTEHTHLLIKNGAVPILINLLTSPNEEVLEQALWVLGNLAGEGTSSRDTVLGNDVLRPLIRCLDSHMEALSLLRIGSWTLSNLFDGQPRPVFDINLVMPILARLLQSEDSEVLSHTCWALSHLCDGPAAHIKVVVEAGVCWRLVELLMHRSWRVTKPALRTIGNIVCAEDETDYTQFILEAGAVPCLRQLIAHNNREIQKEACWTLSNIAAGTAEQIQTVLDSGAMPHLVQLATLPDTDPEVRSEACWVVLNATSCGSDSQIEYLVQEGCVPILGELLSETSMVMMALEGLERVLQVGDEAARRSTVPSNPYASLLSPARLEELEAHKSTAISKRASRIWKLYFVTCAICGLSFGRHSPDASFCDECKCFVCQSCDCSVFHLDYQEEFWKEVTAKEASQKQAQQASKRNKKQKKKQKNKVKKAQAKAKKGEKSSSSDNDSSGDNGLEDPAHSRPPLVAVEPSETVCDTVPSNSVGVSQNTSRRRQASGMGSTAAAAASSQANEEIPERTSQTSIPLPPCGGETGALPFSSRMDGPTENRPTPSDSKVPKPRKARRGKKLLGQDQAEPHSQSTSQPQIQNETSSVSRKESDPPAPDSDRRPSNSSLGEKGKGSPSKTKRRSGQGKQESGTKSTEGAKVGDSKRSGSSDNTQHATVSSPPKTQKAKKATSEGNENDDLVSYLQQTGSILALAELLDQEEDMDSLNS